MWLKRRLPARPAAAVAGGGNWLKSALSMALADGMRVTQVQLVILLLGLLASASATGLFRVAVSILVAIGLPIAIMNSIVAPVMARLFAEGDHRRLQQMCTHSARWMTAGVVALALPFVFWGGPLIGFVFGAEYAPAATPLLILAGGQIVTACFGANIGLLMMTGHEHRVSRAMFWGLLASFVSTLALVPAWSEIGAAVATVGSLLVWNLLTWIDARRFLGIETSAFAKRAQAARFGPDPL
jgi:O-antigen/teichoic acid export membrane protein